MGDSNIVQLLGAQKKRLTQWDERETESFFPLRYYIRYVNGTGCIITLRMENNFDGNISHFLKVVYSYITHVEYPPSLWINVNSHVTVHFICVWIYPQCIQRDHVCRPSILLSTLSLQAPIQA